MSPFLVILVPSSCSPSATVSGASAARPGMWVRGEVSGFAFKVYQCSRAGLNLSSFKLNWEPTKSKTFLRTSSNFSCLPFKLTPDTELLETVHAGDRFGGNWL